MKLRKHWCEGCIFLTLVFLVPLLRTTEARISKIFPCPQRCLCDIVSQRVDCSGEGFYMLPPFIPTNTRILLFQDNSLEDELTVSSFNITTLVRLRQLSLANNSIIDIKEAVFAKQERLIKLDLFLNHLQSIPSAIRHMRLLKHLYLSFNLISEISNHDLPLHSAVEALFLDNNEINVFQDGAFANQKQLQLLYMDGNLISNISSGLFSRLPMLKHLDLSYNRLGADLNLQYELLGDDIPTPKTVELSMGLEPGLGLPVNCSAWFAPRYMPKLENLTLEGNIIKTIAHDAFALFPALKSLNLANNELLKLPPHVLDNVTQLESLWLSGNNLTCLPEDIFQRNSNLQDIDLSRNSLYDIPQKIFFGLEVLLTLDLSQNYLASSAFLGADLRQLAELDMSSNGLADFGTVGFTRMVGLEMLWLQENKLLSVPNIRNLTRLRVIYLSDNFIQYIPRDAFAGVDSLEEIYIERNEMTAINLDPFGDLLLLQIIKAGENPINCDCNMKWTTNFGPDYSYYSYDDVDSGVWYDMGLTESGFLTVGGWVAMLTSEVKCTRPALVMDYTIQYAFEHFGPDLICTHYANPRSIMILILTWFLIIIVFLILFWGRTFWMARKQLGTSRFLKTKKKPKEEDTCYVISSVSKKAGNGQYHLLPDKNENEPLVFLSNHDDETCKMRTFDRSTEIFIETTV